MQEKNSIVNVIKDVLPAHLHVEAGQHLKAARKIIKETGEAKSKEKQIELIRRSIKQQLAGKESMVDRSYPSELKHTTPNMGLNTPSPPSGARADGFRFSSLADDLPWPCPPFPYRVTSLVHMGW